MDIQNSNKVKSNKRSQFKSYHNCLSQSTCTLLELIAILLLACAHFKGERGLYRKYKTVERIALKISTTFGQNCKLDINIKTTPLFDLLVY